MRITNNMLITNMLSNLSTNMKMMSRKQDELATGKRVINASDDPVAAAKIIKFKSDLADMTQYSTNVRDAQAWLDASESSIAEAGTVLQRVRELAVQAANGTNTASDTQKIKEEISQLKNHVVAIANANLAGRYLFASHYTDRPVLDANGNYNLPITKKDTLDPEVALYEVGVNQNMKVGTHAYSFLKGALDTSAFATTMPDALSTDGVAIQKPSLAANFSLTTNYSAGSNITLTVAGKTFTVNKANLVGSATTPLTTGKVLTEFDNAQSAGPPVEILSSYADVFFDQSGQLIVKGKTAGAAATVQMGAPLAAGITIPGPNPATGANAVAATVTASTVINDADAASYAGKKFLMTLNGVTKEFAIPESPVQTTVAALVTQLQGMMDNSFAGFGAGKVTVTGTSGTALKFTSIPAAGETVANSIQIAPVVVKTPKLIKDLDDMLTGLTTANQAMLGNVIKEVDDDLNTVLAIRADIGARGSRLELIDSRINENNITFTRLLSDSQDADMSEVIMFLKNAENVYKSALSVGGRIIQPTLIDFLK